MKPSINTLQDLTVNKDIDIILWEETIIGQIILVRNLKDIKFLSYSPSAQRVPLMFCERTSLLHRPRHLAGPFCGYSTCKITVF